MTKSLVAPGLRFLSRGSVYTLLLLGAFVMLFPLLLMVSISFTPESEVFSWPPDLIPETPRPENYGEIVTVIDVFPRAVVNSIILSVATTITSIVFGAMAGYACARCHFRGHHQVFMLMLSTMMIPAQVLIIPLFVMFSRVPLIGGNDIAGMGGHGLLNTHLGMILPGAVSVVYIFFFRQYFMCLPSELADAARVDGCSEFGIFRRIYLPLARPAMGAVGILAFITSWNNLVWPLIMASTPKMYTLQVALFAYRWGTEYKLWSLLMAGNVLSCLPPFILFILFQRNIVSGMVFSGLKG
jgi:multiple sugar transport system permease protein